MIEVKNLVKYYGEKPAVDGISFCLEPGKVYGFLGPNGAGKSTTMNIMTGYLAASAGDVIIDDYDIVSEPEEVKKRIGYLPEQPPLYMDMTVEEYLMFAAGLKKLKSAERKKAVLEVMEMTGITEYRRRLISNLSKGYKQRVGLSQAILGNPDIIILDEPTVGLDPRQIIEIRELIKKLSLDHTIILSSHIMGEISAVCDHILMIVRGHLIANDTPKALIEKYASDLKVSLKIMGNITEVREILENIEGVGELSVHENPVDRSISDVIITENGIDIRKDIFKACAEADLPILEMKRNEPTLEDVFLKLSSEEEARFAEAREQEELKRVNRKLGKRNVISEASEETASEEEIPEAVNESKEENDDSNI